MGEALRPERCENWKASVGVLGEDAVEPLSGFDQPLKGTVQIIRCELDAVARRLPGALAEGSGELESFSEQLGGGLEYPHYTRPAEFRGWPVPDVLLSGDHARVDAWRREHVR